MVCILRRNSRKIQLTSSRYHYPRKSSPVWSDIICPSTNNFIVLVSVSFLLGLMLHGQLPSIYTGALRVISCSCNLGGCHVQVGYQDLLFSSGLITYYFYKSPLVPPADQVLFFSQPLPRFDIYASCRFCISFFLSVYFFVLGPQNFYFWVIYAESSG